MQIATLNIDILAFLIDATLINIHRVLLPNISFILSKISFVHHQATNVLEAVLQPLPRFLFHTLYLNSLKWFLGSSLNLHNLLLFELPVASCPQPQAQ